MVNDAARTVDSAKCYCHQDHFWITCTKNDRDDKYMFIMRRVSYFVQQLGHDRSAAIYTKDASAAMEEKIKTVWL